MLDAAVKTEKARMQTTLKRAWIESLCTESNEEQNLRIEGVLSDWLDEGFIDEKNNWTKMKLPDAAGPKLKQRRK